jgi:hypothetical protein
MIPGPIPRKSSSKAVFLEEKRRKMSVFGVHHEVKCSTNDGVYGAEEDRRSPTHAPGFSLISTALIIRA